MVRKSDKHRELNEEAIESVYLRGSIDHHLVGMRRERVGGGQGGVGLLGKGVYHKNQMQGEFIRSHKRKRKKMWRQTTKPSEGASDH